MANYRYNDVDIFALLEEKMKSNTQNYRSDFEIDKEFIARAAASERPENKTLLWLSRTNGTQCYKEHDTFIQDTGAHNAWRFFDEQTKDSIVACAIELTGVKDGVLRGNVCELDYHAHVAQVRAQSVEALAVEKVFEDGYVDRVALDRSSYHYYAPLVEKHGSIIDSLAIPADPQALSYVLSEQKRARSNMKCAEISSTNKSKPTLDNMIRSAAEQAGQGKPRDIKEQTMDR